MSQKIKICFLGLLLSISAVAFAEVPVEDISQNVGDESSVVQASAPAQTYAQLQNPSPAPTLTEEQRLSRLENQMQNLVQMNLPQQMSEIQNHIQQIEGQLQEEQHQLKTLSEEQKTYYKDLDVRINHLEKNISQNSTNNTKNNAVENDATPAPANMGETNLYQQAFQLLGKKQFDPARLGFQKYLAQYPQGKFAANSHYWLGEIYLFQKQSAPAEKEFNFLVNKFANSPRISDAKLKLAMIHIGQKKLPQARQELLQIKKLYPDSTAAQLASIQIQQLDIEKQQ